MRKLYKTKLKISAVIAPTLAVLWCLPNCSASMRPSFRVKYVTSDKVMDLTDGGTWRKSGKLPQRRYAGKGTNLAGPDSNDDKELIFQCDLIG